MTASSSLEVSGADVNVPLSKRKLRWSAAGALMFVVLGVTTFVFPSSPVFKVIGIASIAFFGLVLAYNVRRMLTAQPGLTLTAEGVIDRGNALSLGLVRWSDIEDITVSSVNGVRFLVLNVRDQAPYLARGNVLQRMTHRANARLVGSPVSIASTALSISFEELQQLVQKHHEKYTAAHGKPAALPIARVVVK